MPSILLVLKDEEELGPGRQQEHTQWRCERASRSAGCRLGAGRWAAGPWAGMVLVRAGPQDRLGAYCRPCPGAPMTLPYQVYFMRKLWLSVAPGKDMNADTILHYHQVPGQAPSR